MKIASVFGVLFLVSSGSTQFEQLLGLDIASFFDNVGAIEKAFGKSLSKKLSQVAIQVYAGTLTSEEILTFFEELTTGEREGAVEGIITLVQSLERVVSAPGTKDQLRMGLTLAPIVLRQVLKSMSELTTPAPKKKTKEPEDVTQPKKVDGVVVNIKPNETELDESEFEEDMTTDEIRDMLGNLKGTGKVNNDYIEIMEHLVNLADEHEDKMVDERQALDDESTTKTSVKEKVEAGGDRKEQAGGGGGPKENGDKAESEIYKETKKDEL